MTAEPAAVYGVDLSAAANSAGASTWVARCIPDGESLVVEELSSAAEFLALDSTARDDVLPALADELASVEAPAVAGLDFPFSLPAWVLGDDDWRAFVERTPAEWGTLDDVDGPKSLFYRLNDASEDHGGRRRRGTDDEHEGQDPAGWRIKTQTYYGISMLLRPLIANDRISVPPLLSVPDPKLTAVEAYPASLFDQLANATRTGYKNGQRRHVKARRNNVAALRQEGVRFEGPEADDDAADCAVATDDALDAVAAALVAHRNYPDAVKRDYTDTECTEGKIFGLGTGRS
ncbi:DUF429 domain-containing protein [Halobaculum lipolyticum]|uniref:DUF429 domain-containing protein n=1 Tax=Halobaculum lipolyticum TaxID=3032001 RepID=A0ABD5WHJ6_9EURY|nr:DUF429 domain-containing protein [Halobaculum sp. DT31]